MLKYRVNEEYKEDTWESLVGEITTATGDTRYTLDKQNVYVNTSIGTINENVTIDFGNCDIHMSANEPFINTNEGCILNAKFVVSEGNVDVNSLNYGVICTNNENIIENCDILVKGLDVRGGDTKDINLGILTSVNNGKIDNCSVDITSFNVTNGRNVNCGVLAGINNSVVKNCVFRNVQSCTLSSFTLLNFGIVSGICKSGKIHNVTLDSLGTLTIDSSINSNIGLICGVSMGSTIENNALSKIGNVSVLSVDHLYLGSVIGYMDDKSEMTGCFAKDIGSITADACQKSYTGGVVGYVGHGCKVNNCTLENLSRVTTMDSKYATTGGMVSVNNGTVTGSSILNISTMETTESEVISTMGGVIGKNFGTVDSLDVNTLGQISVMNGDTSNIGSICGYNESSIKNVSVKEIDTVCSSGKTANFAGGVCGVNNGMIDACEVKKINSVETFGGTENCTGGLCGHNISLMTNNTVITPILSKIESFGKMSSISNVNNNVFTTIDMSKTERYEYDPNDTDFTNKSFLKHKNITSLEKSFPKTFNEYINHLDTINVKSLKETFRNAKVFNQPLDDWDTSNVKEMTYTFKDAHQFNKDLVKWNVSRVVMGKEDKLQGIFENSMMSGRNVGRFVTNIYNYILMHREKGAPLELGSLPELPEINTFERYVLYTLQMNHNVTFTEDGNKITLDDSNAKTNTEPFIVSFHRDNEKLETKYERVVYLKIDSRYDYIFKIENGDGDNGEHIYFKYNSVTKTYKFFNKNGDAFIKDVYSDEILSNVVENITPEVFYLPASLNSFNNYSLKISPWDLNNQSITLMPKIGIHSIDTAVVNTLKIHSWGDSKFFSMEKMFSGSGITNVFIDPEAGTPDLTYCVSIEAMFKGVFQFNADVSGFQVSRVENMKETFKGCVLFNCDISKWNVSKVTDMTDILDNCMSFNKDILHWNTPTVSVSMKDKFKGTRVTKATLESLETHNVHEFDSMFENATFSSDAYEILDTLNLGSAISTRNMFKGSDFKGDVSQWDISKVRDMSGMFENVKTLNSNFGTWNTKNMRRIDDMFKGTSFAGDLSNWNTNYLVSANGTFELAGDVKGIDKWNITSLRNMDRIFKGVSISNMDDILLSWAKQKIVYTPNLDIGDSEYSSTARPAKIALSSMGWNITGTYTEPMTANMIGDPYITPIYGEVYKIPDVECCYRLYQSKNVSINGKIEKFSNIDTLNEMVLCINESKFDGKLDTENLCFDDMYFITKLVIKVGDHACEYDLEKEDWVTHVPDCIQGNYHVKFIDNLNEFYKKEKINTRQISIGDLKIKLYKCDNPQIHTGIELVSAEKNASGILVYECLSHSAVIKNLYDFRTVHIQKATDNDGTWIKERFFTNNGDFLVKKIRVL